MRAARPCLAGPMLDAHSLYLSGHQSEPPSLLSTPSTPNSESTWERPADLAWRRVKVQREGGGAAGAAAVT